MTIINTYEGSRLMFDEDTYTEESDEPCDDLVFDETDEDIETEDIKGMITRALFDIREL